MIFGQPEKSYHKTLGIQPTLREAQLPLESRIQLAFIYGSLAKQTDTAKSDIDLLLVGVQLSLAELLELLIPLETQLGRKINRSCYTPGEYERR